LHAPSPAGTRFPRDGETVERRAALFKELVALLREPVQSMGISRHDFENWLPRAKAALVKADAITDDNAVSR
jgi:hypothetical protein